MNAFLITLSAVGVLLLTAAPGFLLIKSKKVGEDFISGFSKVLLFVCQPCLAVYTFSNAKFSGEMLFDIAIFLLLTIAIHAIMLGFSCLVLKKKFKEASYRILTIASSFTNCAFFGIPIIEALLPESAAGLILYTTVYATVMNILGWTVGSAIIAGDSRYITAKNVFINPTMLGVVIAVPLFVFSVSLPSDLADMIAIIGRMTTPISMLIMGMRLATTSARTVFLSLRTYVAVLAKGFIMPLCGFLLAMVAPLPTEVKLTFFIISACPTASIVLNFSELIGEAQREAASSVLLSTMLSIVTLPIMVLLLPLL